VKAVAGVEKSSNASGTAQRPLLDLSSIPQVIDGERLAPSHRTRCKTGKDRAISEFFVGFHNHFDRVFRQLFGKLISRRWILKIRAV
jgi:hypothetical protein